MHQDIDILLPIESCKLIINSNNVQIRRDGIEYLANVVYSNLKSKRFNIFNWKSFELHPKKTNEFAINWIFIVDTLNFALWQQPYTQKYEVTYNGVTYNGFWAVCAAINRALDDGYPMTEPNYYYNITSEELKYILRSDKNVEIPMFEERLRVLRETGAILLEEFQGSFLNCIKLANGSAIYLLKLIVDNFPSFKDEVIYMGDKVVFYKKAQNIIADIYSCFEGRGLGHFFDINEITVFADHRMPQVLRYYNAIAYSEELTKFLISNKVMSNGDQYEIEIRAASLIACRLITENVRELIKHDINMLRDQLLNDDSLFIINDIILNFHLWNYRNDNSSEIDYFIPFHKVYSTFY